MRFVPIKNAERQSVLALHTVRQGFVKARTAQPSQIRGLLSEFGLIIPQGIGGHVARQLAALLRLVPLQHSSGGKLNLLGICKRGDIYMRTLLSHVARSVIHWESRKPDSCSWVGGVLKRRNENVAAVALGNKKARIGWELQVHDKEFRSDRIRRSVTARKQSRRRPANPIRDSDHRSHQTSECKGAIFTSEPE